MLIDALETALDKQEPSRRASTATSPSRGLLRRGGAVVAGARADGEDCSGEGRRDECDPPPAARCDRLLPRLPRLRQRLRAAEAERCALPGRLGTMTSGELVGDRVLEVRGELGDEAPPSGAQAVAAAAQARELGRRHVPSTARTLPAKRSHSACCPARAFVPAAVSR